MGVADALKYFEDPPKTLPKQNQVHPVERPPSYKTFALTKENAQNKPLDLTENVYGRKASRPSPQNNKKTNKSFVEIGQRQVSDQNQSAAGIKYLMHQIASLEDQIRVMNMRQNYLADEEKGYRAKLETSFKVVNEQTNLLVNDIINRVGILDELIKKEETRASIFTEKVF